MRLLVLGGGPAGLNAALQGRELNAQVTLIEADRLGGTSLNRGPAPVRTLARAARLVRDTHAWPAFGLRGPSPEVDLAATLDNAGRTADYAWPARPPPTSGCRGRCRDPSRDGRPIGYAAGFRGCCAHSARRLPCRNPADAPRAGPRAGPLGLQSATRRSRTRQEAPQEPPTTAAAA
jgi:hypothetical protein